MTDYSSQFSPSIKATKAPPYYSSVSAPDMAAYVMLLVVDDVRPESTDYTDVSVLVKTYESLGIHKYWLPHKAKYPSVSPSDAAVALCYEHLQIEVNHKQLIPVYQNVVTNSPESPPPDQYPYIPPNLQEFPDTDHPKYLPFQLYVFAIDIPSTWFKQLFPFFEGGTYPVPVVSKAHTFPAPAVACKWLHFIQSERKSLPLYIFNNPYQPLYEHDDTVHYLPRLDAYMRHKFHLRV